MLGEKLLVSGLDINLLRDFKQALNKVRAVIDNSDSDYLSSLDADLEVLPTGSHFPFDYVIRGDQNEQAPYVPHQGSVDEQGTLKNLRAQSSGDHWLRECRSAVQTGVDAEGKPQHADDMRKQIMLADRQSL